MEDLANVLKGIASFLLIIVIIKIGVFLYALPGGYLVIAAVILGIIAIVAELNAGVI